MVNSGNPQELKEKLEEVAGGIVQVVIVLVSALVTLALGAGGAFRW